VWAHLVCVSVKALAHGLRQCSSSSCRIFAHCCRLGALQRSVVAAQVHSLHAILPLPLFRGAVQRRRAQWLLRPPNRWWWSRCTLFRRLMLRWKRLNRLWSAPMTKRPRINCQAETWRRAPVLQSWRELVQAQAVRC